MYYIVRMNIFRYLFRSFVFVHIFVCGVWNSVYIDKHGFYGISYFHYIFDNDLWPGSRADVLIQMVPEKFFYDMVVRIMVYFITGVVVMGALLGYLSARLSGGKNTGWDRVFPIP